MLGLVTNGANLIVSECFDVIFYVLFLLLALNPSSFLQILSLNFIISYVYLISYIVANEQRVGQAA